MVAELYDIVSRGIIYYMSFYSSDRLAQFSIVASVCTIGLKLVAYFLTDSVSLLSDALESFVNLIAAVMTFFMLRLAQKPPDATHHYGHTKAEYFSSIAEGLFIILAAGAIISTAVWRIVYPVNIETPVLGLAFSVAASIINLIVGQLLIREGRKRNSIALEADGHHLMTDVWTTVGVLIALGIIFITGIHILDPIMAIVFGFNIIFSGVSILNKSLAGFMDSAIDTIYINHIQLIFKTYSDNNNLRFHGLRTRISGSRKFITFHVLVPGDWSVQKAHSIVEQIEKNIRTEIPQSTVTTHIEPIEDPNAYNDDGLDC